MLTQQESEFLAKIRAAISGCGLSDWRIAELLNSEAIMASRTAMGPLSRSISMPVSGSLSDYVTESLKPLQVNARGDMPPIEVSTGGQG